MNYGKYRILENDITACSYVYILCQIARGIQENKSLLISPIASQTLVAAKQNLHVKKTLNTFDLLVPDSQWVVWSIYFLYGVRINKRIYGPLLMRKVCEKAEKQKYAIFLYGTDSNTLKKLTQNLQNDYPKLILAGNEPSKFRELTNSELSSLAQRIEASRADIVFVGLGSPLQEEFAVLLSKKLKVNKVIIPIGAAFDFIAGTKQQAPSWIGDIGLEWLYRLLHEPKRLMKRYIIYSNKYIIEIILQKIWFNYKQQNRNYFHG